MKLDTFNRTVTFKGWITKETDLAYLFSIKKGKRTISYWLPAKEVQIIDEFIKYEKIYGEEYEHTHHEIEIPSWLYYKTFGKEK